MSELLVSDIHADGVVEMIRRRYYVGRMAHFIVAS